MIDKDNQHSFVKTYVIAVIICIGFLAFSLLFIFHIMRLNQQESANYLNESAQQSQTSVYSVERWAPRSSRMRRSGARILSRFPERFSKEDSRSRSAVIFKRWTALRSVSAIWMFLNADQIGQLLKRINDNNVFIRMGFADKNGIIDFMILMGIPIKM